MATCSCKYRVGSQSAYFFFLLSLTVDQPTVCFSDKQQCLEQLPVPFLSHQSQLQCLNTLSPSAGMFIQEPAAVPDL